MSHSQSTTLHVQIHGKVQGVFFRDYTRRKAEELNIIGWVRNSPDGSVEAFISGEDMQIKKMLEWFEQGSPYASVQKVSTRASAEPPVTKSFLIKY